MQNGPQQRRAQRESVIMAAVCRTATGRKGDVSIVDLTAEGCCVFIKSVPLSEGLRVTVRPLAFEPLAGIVRWVRRGYAGIEFEKSLYGPVAVHLQKTWSAAR